MPGSTIANHGLLLPKTGKHIGWLMAPWLASHEQAKEPGRGYLKLAQRTGHAGTRELPRRQALLRCGRPWLGSIPPGPVRSWFDYGLDDEFGGIGLASCLSAFAARNTADISQDDLVNLQQLTASVIRNHLQARELLVVWMGKLTSAGDLWNWIRPQLRACNSQEMTRHTARKSFHRLLIPRRPSEPSQREKILSCAYRPGKRGFIPG